ncbi:MAG: sulfatase/phosphatase domain-containing protein, partial [Flavobacteriaceae bacterium]
NIPKGNKVEADIYLQDAMATSLELAGVEKPNYVFFNSVLDLAKGTETESHYDAIYGAYVNLQRMIRKDGFKLIVYPKLDKVLLFDMENDPEEMNDLSDNEAYAEKVNQLFSALLEKQKALNDHLDLTNLSQKITARTIKG